MATETRKIQEPEKAGRFHAARRAVSSFFSRIGRNACKPGPEPIQDSPKISPQSQIELNRALLHLQANRPFPITPGQQLEWANAVAGLIEAGAKIEDMAGQIDDTDDRCKSFASLKREWRTDSLIGILLETEHEHGKSLYQKAIRNLAENLLTSKEDFASWSHTAYHLFGEGKSLLEHKENHAVAELLLEEGAKRAIAAQEKGFLGSMLGPVLEHNISHAQTTGSEEFGFKPKCIENPQLIALLKKISCEYPSYHKLVALCESSSMPELMERLAQAANAGGSPQTAMQESKPGSQPIQETGKALSLQEPKELNEALLLLLNERFKGCEPPSQEDEENLAQLINRGAKLESAKSWDAEALVLSLLEIETRHNKSLFREAIFDAVQQMLSYEGDSFGAWYHDIFHLLVDYNRASKIYWNTSLLDRKENHPAVEAILDEMARRASVEWMDKELDYYITRTLCLLAEYNMHIAQSADSGEFAFKPKSLSKLESVSCLEGAAEDFFESRTPEELMGRLRDMSQIEKEHTPGLFVDVSGTLIGSDGKLNQKVIARMKEAIASGTKICVFTGGSVREAKRMLDGLGFEDIFTSEDVFTSYIPVEPKSAYFGRKLEMLIDDTPPEYQGFAATDWKKPEEL